MVIFKVEILAKRRVENQTVNDVYRSSDIVSQTVVTINVS